MILPFLPVWGLDFGRITGRTAGRVEPGNCRAYPGSGDDIGTSRARNLPRQLVPVFSRDRSRRRQTGISAPAELGFFDFLKRTETSLHGKRLVQVGDGTRGEVRDHRR